MQILELKRALTYEEQVRRFIDEHGLCVLDEEYAVDILKKVNYYRLSAYGIGLKQRNNLENYNDGVSIETLYRLYLFDSQFKNILLHIIEQIEIQLRTQISNLLAVTYGPNVLEISHNFENKTTSSIDSAFSKNSCNITESTCIGQPGDLINSRSGHVELIIAVDQENGKYFVAHSGGPGVVMQERPLHKGNSSNVTKIIFMEEFYSNQMNVNASY